MTETEIDIRDLTSKIADLDTMTESGDFDETDLIASINAAEKKINDLIADFDALAQAYDEEYASTSTIRSTSAGFHASSVTSSAFIKTLIQSEAPICAVALIVIFLIGLINEVRRSGKAKKTQKANSSEAG